MYRRGRSDPFLLPNHHSDNLRHCERAIHPSPPIEFPPSRRLTSNLTPTKLAPGEPTPTFPTDLQKHPLPCPNLPFRIIFHIHNVKHLPQPSHKPHIGAPALLEGKKTHRRRTQHVAHRGQQQRERGFEVDAVGGEQDGRVGRDAAG